MNYRQVSPEEKAASLSLERETKLIGEGDQVLYRKRKHDVFAKQTWRIVILPPYQVSHRHALRAQDHKTRSGEGSVVDITHMTNAPGDQVPYQRSRRPHSELHRSVTGATEILLRFDSTQVLLLEQRTGLDVCHLDEQWYEEALRPLYSDSETLRTVRVIQTALDRLASDVEEFGTLGEEELGDSVAGRLSGDTGVAGILSDLFGFLSASMVELDRDLQCKLLANAVRHNERRSRHSQEVQSSIRSEVDRIKLWLEAEPQVRTLADVEAKVDCSWLGETSATAVALLASLESKCSLRVDWYFQSLSESLCGTDPVAGTLILPVPVPRSLKQDLLPYVATSDGKLFRGALTGDVWFEVVRAECVGGDTAFTFNKSERPLGVPVLPCDWAELVPLREIGTHDVHALDNVLGGRDSRVATLYGKFRDCAFACDGINGRCAAKAWLEALTGWETDKSAMRTLVARRVSLRSAAAIYAGSLEYMSFCRGIVGRIVGTMPADAACITASGFQVHTWSRGPEIMVAVGLDGESNTNRTDVEAAERLLSELISVNRRRGAMFVPVDSGIGLPSSSIVPDVEFVSSEKRRSMYCRLWYDECHQITKS